MPIGRADHTEGVAPPSAGGEDGCCRTAAPRAAVHRHRLQPYVHQRHVITVSVAKPGGGTIATLAKKVFAMNGDVTLASFPAGGTALVIGASGAIGAAFVEKLRQAPSFVRVIGLGRTTAPALDVTVEASISAAATAIHAFEPRLVINATGFLHEAGYMPERSWRHLKPEHMARAFAVNAIGPALLMKHFLPKLPRTGKAMFATLSAKVASIRNNQLGGWYSYRASKAALNQLVHTAAIELKRQRLEAICVALHPGTVDTPLSAPFAKAGLTVRPPAEAVSQMLAVIDALTPAQSGGFFDYQGRELPW